MILYRLSALASLPALNRTLVVSCTIYRTLTPRRRYNITVCNPRASGLRCNSSRASLWHFACFALPLCAIFLNLRNYAKFFARTLANVSLTMSSLLRVASAPADGYLTPVRWTDAGCSFYVFAQENMRRNNWHASYLKKQLLTVSYFFLISI